MLLDTLGKNISGLHMNTKEELTTRGIRFLEKLGSRHILFSGISGSVSYSPEEDDDIDIFIITTKNRLWSTLLKAFVIRIINADRKICLSLTMDSGFAHTLFAGNGDFIMASDSMHAIPYVGEDYYRNLLAKSPFVKKYYPDYANSFPLAGVAELDSRATPLEFLSFFLLSALLTVKGLIHNHSYIRAGKHDQIFRTIISFHSFYFDSVKYHQLKEAHAEAFMEDL